MSLRANDYYRATSLEDAFQKLNLILQILQMHGILGL